MDPEYGSLGVVAGPSSDHCIDGQDSEDIILNPCYAVYCDDYYTSGKISFSTNSIKMEGLTTKGDGRTCTFEWGTDDIHHIKSDWHKNHNMALVVIHLRGKKRISTGNVLPAAGTELKFTVHCSSRCLWLQRVEAIASLNVIYKCLWTNSGDDVLEPTRKPSPKHFSNFSRPFDSDFDPEVDADAFPISKSDIDISCTFSRPFKSFYYPEGDADRFEINKNNFDTLQPEQHLDDIIVDFYIMYLAKTLQEDVRDRFHFFGSKFFSKWEDYCKREKLPLKYVPHLQERERQKRKVNIFQKDFLIIPVVYCGHWSLIVICHPGDVATYNDEDVANLKKSPCILHMNSARGCHNNLEGIFQSFLKEEWKCKNSEVSEEICLRFDKLRFISLEVPQQENSDDCGLFLLHYVELFLKEPPLHVNPCLINNTLNRRWFAPDEASSKRTVIQKIIINLQENSH